ncbi:hypothetical protein So717_12270 [Roseobacter cerasinus]|uniref:N-acetyltransferase domain-containing protein n=1 Tax=Roseobacter cerasinus TaxID=2602289 RepID=A0A640VPC1_9RHOB|nr:GNAT family N-acetyltransferase [Roseobacter cerasinus]GFE49474.1 hypothetical protein So717_12270 [Roseobacter cerasinus]
MPGLKLSPITQTEHASDVFNLTLRATDYVTLEIGHAPTHDFVDSFFTAAPPGLTTDDLLHFAVMEGPAMAGIVCIARGYEFPNDWWIGLVLLDPAFRGRGIGTATVGLIKEHATAQAVASLKLSVLEANPRAMHFWIQQGFLPHRYALATPDSDGHNRWVLTCDL